VFDNLIQRYEGMAITVCLEVAVAWKRKGMFDIQYRRKFEYYIS
jgi:hypothetical protein